MTDLRIQERTAGSRRSLRSHRVLITVAVVATVTAAGAAALLYGPTRQAPAPATGARLPPATKKVIRGDMVEEVRAIGPVGFSGSQTIKNQIQGIITWTPAANSTVGRGGTLYRVDDKPVLLLLGDLPAWRDFRLGMSDGKDVRLLEENLAALGYTDFTVDEKFSPKTEAAVRRWQKESGLPVTGRIELGRAAFLPAPIRVGKVTGRPGDPAERGAEVLQVTGTARRVRVEIPVADAALAIKTRAVKVVLPDGGDADGVVSSVGVTRLNKEGKQVVPVSVRVTGRGIEHIQSSDVIVVFKRIQAKNVLSVPVTALLPRAGGGYAVEVVDDAGTHTVPVTTGAFAGGRAEVGGPGLTVGTRVGVPRL